MSVFFAFAFPDTGYAHIADIFFANEYVAAASSGGLGHAATAFFTLGTLQPGDSDLINAGLIYCAMLFVAVILAESLRLLVEGAANPLDIEWVGSVRIGLFVASALFLIVGPIVFLGWYSLAVLAAWGVYSFPQIISEKHHNHRAIALLNLLLGWTVIGWIVALVWSQTRPSSG